VIYENFLTIFSKHILYLKKKIKPDSWARIKLGIYKGDLAQIVRVEMAQNQVILKLIPRIDFSLKDASVPEVYLFYFKFRIKS